jgi:hypothetical protein
VICCVEDHRQMSLPWYRCPEQSRWLPTQLSRVELMEHGRAQERSNFELFITESLRLGIGARASCGAIWIPILMDVEQQSELEIGIVIHSARHL